jgi:hypothetical protein
MKIMRTQFQCVVERNQTHSLCVDHVVLIPKCAASQITRTGSRNLADERGMASVRKESEASVTTPAEKLGEF